MKPREISFVDLSLTGRELDETTAAMRRVMEGGYFVLGPELAAFEEAMAALHGFSHVVGVGSGTDALIMGLRAIGVGPGDEVIVPAMTAFPTAAAVMEVGATPVLVDIEENRPVLDLNSAVMALTPATKAVMLVHLYGVVADAGAWAGTLTERNVVLIEDCAQAQGGHLPDGRSVGSAGRFAGFSFYPTKNLGALGDAGALVTEDQTLAGEVRAWRSHGERTVRYAHDLPARNSRLDEIQAAILALRLRDFVAQLERRKALSAAYEHLLSPAARYVSHADAGAPHLAVVRVPEREALMSHLRSRGIASMVHYPRSLAEQEALRGRARLTSAPNALRWSRECVSLPLYPRMTMDELAYVVEVTNDWLEWQGQAFHAARAL